MTATTAPALLEVSDLRVRYAAGTALWATRQLTAVAGVDQVAA